MGVPVKPYNPRMPYLQEHSIHRLTRPGAVALLLLACTVELVQAQVYRCERDGVIRYSDKPCEQNARPVQLPEPIVVPAGPQADLLGEARHRDAERRTARDLDDAAWLKVYEARKAEEDRLRSGRVTGTVVEGMAPADVRRIHGEPAVVSSAKGKKGARETWSYVLGDGRRLHVTFIEGRVSDVRTREEKR